MEMDKKDIMILIQACVDFKKLDNVILMISEGNIDDQKYPGLYMLTDILYMHSKLSNYDKLLDIVYDELLTIEEKYELIF